MKNWLRPLSLLILIGTGCSPLIEQSDTEYSQVLLQIEGNISGATSRACNNQWNHGDAIGVSAIGADNAIATCENYQYTTLKGDGIFKHTGDILYFPTDGSRITLRAYYPYGEINNHLYALDLSDQSHQPSIDFMTAQSEGNNGNNSTISMQFAHRLSKLELNIEGVSAEQEISVRMDQQSVKLKYNLQDDRLIVEENKQDILFYQTGNKAEAILAPNTLEDNPPTDRRLTITVNGNSYSVAILSTTSFRPGYRHRYTFRLNIDGTASVKGVDITPWTLVSGEEIGNIHTFKRAPLYWSIYEYCLLKEQQGMDASQMNMDAGQWIEVADWVSTHLLPHGYDMLCTDGFIPMICESEPYGYMDKYGSMHLKDLASICRDRGLKLGIYDNPLWLHGNDQTPVPNTNFTQKELKYNPDIDRDMVLNPDTEDKWFTYLIATHPGAQEYIDGFFKYYKKLGVEYIRMDFLSWYETGTDRGMGVVGRGYGTECYKLALRYIAQAAKKYGIFTSLVMPHLKDNAQWEKEYGNMVRIVADTGFGGWYHCSDADRGKVYDSWPNCMNMYDGFMHWSKITGRNHVIPDGDFIRLNKFDTEHEKRAVISLQLMAGGPIAVADQPSTIGENNLQFYTNDEILALNRDGFVGKPLDSTVTSHQYEYNDVKKDQIWYGQMSNGDYVVCIFNREGIEESRYVDLKWLGLEGNWKTRDLWTHTDEGEHWEIKVDIPAHGCKMMRLSK